MAASNSTSFVNSQQISFGIHWFRRDLHIAGNQSLAENFKKNNGRVLGLFCFDSTFLSRKDFSHNRFGFFLNTLKELKSELLSNGGDLLVVDALPLNMFHTILSFCEKYNNHLSAVSFSRDYEPFARLRDNKVCSFLEKNNIQVITARDHLLFEPHEVLKEDQTFYQVYSPFARKWFSLFSTHTGHERTIQWSKGMNYLNHIRDGKNVHLGFRLKWFEISGWNDFCKKNHIQDALNHFIEKNTPQVTITLPPAGTMAAFKILVDFENKLNQYADNRDVPAKNGTSLISIYLKNGSLTVPQVISYLSLGKQKNIKSKSGPTIFLKELIWREFYYSILWHRPEVEHSSFIEKCNSIEWQNNTEWFELWKQGKTGYPIVDAGMRQLNSTGWMHNRVRMIVASFLTKDLLISWQWGERYFMEQLLDGDLAPNNGGWQWAASTGCDPQPYFRIFNPKLQSERFDPDGSYIRKYVPELRSVHDSEIHDPSPLTRKACGYPMPVVDHHEQKNKALALFSKLK